jgi:type I restriction enzyme, S subunit
MELKHGYKQTELGVIPEEWDAVRIGDLFTLKNGLNKAKRFFGHGTPIVNYMDVFGRPGLRVGEIGGRVDVSAKELCAYEVLKGDVFFTRTSETVEEIGIASVMLDEPARTVYSGFVLRARPSDESLDEVFKAYCFSPRYFRQQVIARASYTTRALTNGRSLSAALLARPPKPEQRAIAASLSDVDALLGGLDRLIAKKRDLKQAAMQQLLTGQTRLPGFHGEWEVKRLGELGSTYGGLTGKTKSDFFGNGEARYITFMNVMSNVVIDCQSFDHVRVAPNDPQNEVVRGDLLFNGSSETPEEVAMCSLLTEDVPNLYLNSFCFGFRLRSNALVDGLFVAYLIRGSTGREVMKSLAQGSTRYNLSKVALLNAPVQLPSIDEQSAIATVLSDMDAELAALEARRDKTRSLKQAMMQELLTGRIRLVTPEHVLE